MCVCVEEEEGCVCVLWKEKHQQAVNQALATACHSSIELVRGRMGSPWDPERRKEEEVQEGRWREQGRR